MDFVTTLWMPIVVSAVLVFIASSIIWMATPLHKHDYKDPGDKENAMLEFYRSQNLARGVYFVPWCHGKDRKDPAVIEKMKRGPYVMTTVMPAQPNMGKTLGLWMVHLLLVGLFVAYVAHLATPLSGAPYLKVFRVAGAAAFLAHAGFALPMCLWHGQPWSTLPGRIIDGLVYSLLTAGAFGWLWPHAPSA